MVYTDNISVTDQRGFKHPVCLKHFPINGVSIAYYKGSRIAQKEYGRMTAPAGDVDHEWEVFEMRFRESLEGLLSDFEKEISVELGKQL